MNAPGWLPTLIAVVPTVLWAILFFVAKRRYSRDVQALEARLDRAPVKAETDYSRAETRPDTAMTVQIATAEQPMILECPTLDGPNVILALGQTIPDQRPPEAEPRTEPSIPPPDDSAAEARARRLDDLISALPLPLLLAEPSTGAIEYRNQAFDSTFGYDAEISSTVSVYTLLGAIDEQSRSELRDLATGQISGPKMMNIWRADGSTFPARVQGTFHHAGAGERNTMMLMIEDISKERQTDSQRELFAAALEATEDAILIIDMNGTITHANQAGTKMYGRNLEGTQLAASHIFELSEDGPHNDFVDAVFRTGTWSNEILRVCDDGACRPTGLTLSRLMRPDQDTVAVAVARDLSAQSEMQDEVLRANKLATLGELAGGITHEISNPLTSILENARYIAESFENDQMDETCAEAAEDTLGAARRMKSILEEVRRFSHMGRSGCAETTFDSAVNSALMLAGPAVRHHAHVLRPQGAGPEIWGDQGHLTQVLLNLFKNAAEAMRDLGKVGTIRLEHGTEGSQAFLRVIDDGPGIPEAVQQRLFKEYITTKERGRGTGFGLRLCAKLLEEDGGRIELQSTVGKGATFTLFVPLATAMEVRDAEIEPPARGGVEITMMSELDPETEEALREALSMTMPAPGPDLTRDTVDLFSPPPVHEVPPLMDTRSSKSPTVAGIPQESTTAREFASLPAYSWEASRPYPEQPQSGLQVPHGAPPAYDGSFDAPPVIHGLRDAADLPQGSLDDQAAPPSPPVLRSRSSEMLIEPELPVPIAFANDDDEATRTVAMDIAPTPSQPIASNWPWSAERPVSNMEIGDVLNRFNEDMSQIEPSNPMEDRTSAIPLRAADHNS